MLRSQNCKTDSCVSGNLSQKPCTDPVSTAYRTSLAKGQVGSKALRAPPGGKPVWATNGKCFMGALEGEINVTEGHIGGGWRSSTEGGTQHSPYLFCKADGYKPSAYAITLSRRKQTQTGTPDRNAQVCTHPSKVNRMNKNSDSQRCLLVVRQHTA